jgi:hypothetical protein
VKRLTNKPKAKSVRIEIEDEKKETKQVLPRPERCDAKVKPAGQRSGQ